MQGKAVEAPMRGDASRLLLPMIGSLTCEIDCFAYAEILYSLYRSPYADRGFDDYFFFINSFTKAHGISPSVYSKKEKL